MSTKKTEYSVVKIGDKFVVQKNGQKIVSTQDSGAVLVTEFDSKQDAEKYASILKSLCSTKAKN